MHYGLSCIQHDKGNRCLSVTVGKMVIKYDERARGVCSGSEEGNDDDDDDDDEVVLVGVFGEEGADEMNKAGRGGCARKKGLVGVLY